MDRTNNNLTLNQGISFLFISVILISLVYFSGLSGPFIYDDYVVVVPLIEKITSGFPPEWMSNSGPLGRPISMASFIANIQLFGATTFSFKLVNLIIHVFNFLLVYFILNKLVCFSLSQKLNRGQQLLLVAVPSLLWALHPLHISTVLYTVQRMTELSTFFVLLGMLFYCYGRCPDKSGKFDKRIFIYISFIICMPLAIFSKENGALFPLFLLLLELCFFRFKGPKNLIKHVKFLFLFLLLIPVVLVAVYYLVNFQELIVIKSQSYGFEFYERLMTQFRVVTQYIVFTFWPDITSTSFYYDHVEISRSFINPISTLFSFLFLMGLFVLVILAFTKWQNKLLAFGLLFFFTGHLLESSILPLKIMFEHRNYLPSLGLLLAVFSLLKDQDLSERKFYYLSITLVVVFFALSVTRASTWGDKISFAVSSYLAAPDSQTATAEYVELLTQNKKYHEAVQVLELSAGERPYKQGPYIQKLYIQCLQYGQLEDSIFLDISRETTPLSSVYPVTGLMEISRLGLEDACRFNKKLLIESLQAYSKRPMSVTAWRSKLLIHKAYNEHYLGEYNTAQNSLKDAYHLNQSSPIPLLLSAKWLHEVGDKKQALKMLEKAKSVAEKAREDYSQSISEIEAIIGK